MQLIDNEVASSMQYESEALRILELNPNSDNIDVIDEVELNSRLRIKKLYLYIYDAKGNYINEYGFSNFTDSQNIPIESQEHVKQAIESQQSQYFKSDTAVKGYATIYVPIIKDFETKGVMQIISQNEVMQNIKEYNYAAYLLLIPLGLVTGYVFGFVAYQWAFRPLREMLRKMAVSNANNLHAKMYIIGNPDDEFDQLAKTYNDMLDRIKEGIDKQQEFTANISHELRKPLTSIVSDIEIIEMALLEDDKKAALEQIKETKRYMFSLGKTLESMLSLAQMTTDQNIYEEVSLHNCLDAVLKSLNKDIVDKKLQVEVIIPKHLEIYFAPQHLSILLNNLVNNAVKYNKTNGKIVISTQVIDDAVVVKVADTGIGMTEKTRKYIVKRFYRSDDENVMRSEGFGIGLDIVDTICKLHRLGLDFTSKLNQGTTVTISGFKQVETTV